MTDKELKKLRKLDLFEIILEQEKEIERLNQLIEIMKDSAHSNMSAAPANMSAAPDRNYQESYNINEISDIESSGNNNPQFNDYDYNQDYVENVDYVEDDFYYDQFINEFIDEDEYIDDIYD